MPLEQRQVADIVDVTRLCGVETDFDMNINNIIHHDHELGGFDFVLTPLTYLGFKPSGSNDEDLENLTERLLPYEAGTNLNISAEKMMETVMGKISTWIDLDSNDEILRMDSEAVLKRQIEWASYLTLKCCVLPTPKGNSCANYARCVSQILQGLKNMRLLLRIPIGMSDDDHSSSFNALVDSWQTWNSFRLLCDHHSNLAIALDIMRVLPPENSQKRWYGEPVMCAILDPDIFVTNTRGPKYLPRRHQKLITDLFTHSIQIIISGTKVSVLAPSAEGSQHPLRPYLDQVSNIHKQMELLSPKEHLQFHLRDFLQPPLRPLKNYLEALSYAKFEEDAVKYNEYERAICKALLDRVPEKLTSEITTVLVVVGAGRGCLVQASLQASEKTGRKIRVYAVEKNPKTAIALDELIRLKNWVDSVFLVPSDVRYWDAPEKADILVSDLFGSFGDNELSPESLDGAQRFLNKNGISIPSSYTSYLQPLTASWLYTEIKARKYILNSESACLVKLHRVARLAPSQKVFTFTHPKCSDSESNERYKKLHFVIPKDTGSAMVHGFAGYFDATLYKDVRLGTEPSITATPDVISWLPMFFPLRTPILVDPGSPLEVHFWRCVDSKKVWYEWCVTSPSVSPIHNCNGRSCCMEL